VGTEAGGFEVEVHIGVGGLIDFVFDFLLSIHLQYLERIEVEIKLA